MVVLMSSGRGTPRCQLGGFEFGRGAMTALLALLESMVAKPAIDSQLAECPETDFPCICADKLRYIGFGFGLRVRVRVRV